MYEKIHFIGIGGVSMSGLAHIMLDNNVKVSGSDSTDSKIIESLKRSGGEIYIGHSKENITDCDLVVYTAAISQDNVELLEAKKRGIKTLERANFLGEIMKNYQNPIAVCGTHGKTTTTSMLSCVLLKSDLDPTILVGGALSQIGGNYRIGSHKYLVFEACEYVDSFLKFNPTSAIVLNVDKDHLDYFSGIEQIKTSFHNFMKKMEPNGVVVLNCQDQNVMEAAEGVNCNKITYGDGGDFQAKNIKYNKNGCGTFDLCKHGNVEVSIALNVAGEHNILNALSVVAICDYYGVSYKNIKEGIEMFTGAKRRFDYKGEIFGVEIYDDYAHHPTEISATLSSAKKMKANKIWCVFQPHTYSRTKALLSDFAAALSVADKVIITDIYASREKDKGIIHAKDLADKLDNAIYISDFDEIAKYIKTNAKSRDIVFTMGAGDVYKIADILLED